MLTEVYSPTIHTLSASSGSDAGLAVVVVVAGLEVVVSGLDVVVVVMGLLCEGLLPGCVVLIPSLSPVTKVTTRTMTDTTTAAGSGL